MNEDDPFAGFSDLSQDDFRVLDAATQFMTVSPSTSILGANGSDAEELIRLRAELAATKQRAEFLEKNLINLQQDKMTKEGEVAILRERLNKIEKERNDALCKTNERLQQSEQSRQAIEEEYRRATDALKSELAFKDQELESLISKMDFMRISTKAEPSTAFKLSRVESSSFKNSSDIPEGFEDLSKKRTISALPISPISEDSNPREKSTDKPRSILPINPSDSELLDTALRCVDAIRDISGLLKYDYEEILARRDKMHKLLRETCSILATLEISYDSSLKWLRPTVFLYFVRLIPACLMINPQLARNAYNRSAYPQVKIYDGVEYKNCQLIPKMCAFLNNPPFGLHPYVTKGHFDAFQCMLANATNAIPLELKDLMDSGFFAKTLDNILQNQKYLQIGVDYIEMLQCMTCDRAAVAHLLRPSPEPLVASLMAILVKCAIERMKKEVGKPDDFLLTLVQFLLHLGRRNLLPVHIAFDKRFLRELVKYFGEQLRLKLIDFKIISDYEVFIRSLHFVFCERKLPLQETLMIGSFILYGICEILLNTRKHLNASLTQQLKDLYEVTERFMLEWIELRDRSMIDPKQYPNHPQI